MISKHQLKVLLRARSRRFLADREASAFRPGLVRALEWKGHQVHYRPGSSDPEVIYKILLKGGRKADYWIPPEVTAEVIWDIGANIGSASVYLARRFPAAKIHAFEPVPENFVLVEKNAAGLAVTPHNLALGARDGELEISASDYPLNFGGFSFHYNGAAPAAATRVRMARPDTLIAQGIPPPDLIKIDTEGAEWDILTAFPEEVLAGVRWIVGELHSVRSFELLEYLSRWFLIETRKSMKSPLFMFSAKNKSAG
jgi:FkbM family methyltransferase